MGKPIESDALDRLYRLLGLSGGAVPVGTLLDDGNVSLVLGVNEIVRRSRTPAATSGWYICVFENVHAAAGPITSSIDPYSPTDALAVAPFPGIVPRGFDFWILSTSLRRVAGAGGLDGAVLTVTSEVSQGGWGVDNAGALVTAQHAFPLARWTALDTATTFAFGITGDGSASVRLATRIPAGIVSLSFISDAAAAATFRCYLMCGLFPEGLGQDIAP